MYTFLRKALEVGRHKLRHLIFCIRFAAISRNWQKRKMYIMVFLFNVLHLPNTFLVQNDCVNRAYNFIFHQKI